MNFEIFAVKFDTVIGLGNAVESFEKKFNFNVNFESKKSSNHETMTKTTNSKKKSTTK